MMILAQTEVRRYSWESRQLFCLRLLAFRGLPESPFRAAVSALCFPCHLPPFSGMGHELWSHSTCVVILAPTLASYKPQVCSSLSVLVFVYSAII